jgi:hypothetical protein
MKIFKSAKFKLYALAGSAVAAMLAFAGSASAAADPVLTSAVGQGTSYFSSNIGVIIGAFVAVAALLWLLTLGFRSMGIRRKGSL